MIGGRARGLNSEVKKARNSGQPVRGPDPLHQAPLPRSPAEGAILELAILTEGAVEDGKQDEAHHGDHRSEDLACQCQVPRCPSGLAFHASIIRP